MRDGSVLLTPEAVRRALDNVSTVGELAYVRRVALKTKAGREAWYAVVRPD